MTVVVGDERDALALEGDQRSERASPACTLPEQCYPALPLTDALATAQIHFCAPARARGRGVRGSAALARSEALARSAVAHGGRTMHILHIDPASLGLDLLQVLRMQCKGIVIGILVVVRENGRQVDHEQSGHGRMFTAVAP